MDISVEIYFSNDSEADNVGLTRIRRSIRSRSNPLELPTAKFISFFRLNKEAFMYLLREMEGHFKQSTRTSAISPVIKLCTAFRFFADGSYQKCWGEDYNVGLAQSTFSVVLEEVLKIFEQLIAKSKIVAILIELQYETDLFIKFENL